MSMGKRRLKMKAAEEDAVTRWRHLYCYVQRSGVRAGIKRQYRKRERAVASQQLRSDRYDGKACNDPNSRAMQRYGG